MSPNAFPSIDKNTIYKIKLESLKPLLRQTSMAKKCQKSLCKQKNDHHKLKLTTLLTVPKAQVETNIEFRITTRQKY